MIVVESLSEFARYIKKLISRMIGVFVSRKQVFSREEQDSREAILGHLRERFARDIKRNFGESKSPEGEIWSPLKYRKGKPLIKTGKLMQEAEKAALKTEFDNRVKEDNVIGFVARMTKPDYWKYHQYGTKRIPKRKFFGIRQDTLSDFGEFVAKEFCRAIVVIVRDSNEAGQ